jgi:hypothetical protein
VAHLFPTKSVVRGFGDISQDNKNIIAMEWLVEGVALIFVGVLVVIITVIDPIMLPHNYGNCIFIYRIQDKFYTF